MVDVLEALGGLRGVLVYADADYVIRWVSGIGAQNYARFGGRAIVGRSLFDCHAEASCEKIRAMYAGFRDGSLRSSHAVRLVGQGRAKHVVYLPTFTAEGFAGCVELQFFAEAPPEDRG